jgi:hypothetical protein
MHRERSLCFGIAMICALLALGSSAAAEPDPGQATLPLEEILRLYREQEEKAKPEVPAPPVRASVQGAELRATLLQDALEVEADLEVVVLAEDGAWTSVELLNVASTTHLASLPKTEAGMLVVRDGKLVFLTRAPGRYPIKLTFLEQATAADARRLARIALPAAGPSELRVRFSTELFALAEEPVRQDAGGALVLPRNGAFEVAWRTLDVAQREPEPAEPAAAADPLIANAHASSVATLEGERITRVAYDLRFSGRRPLAFELPEGENVQQAYLNGRAVPFGVEGRTLSLAVAPARPGGDRAQLELVLTHEMPDFLLSGTLHLELPAPAWPTSELSLRLHLPEVFEYEWSSGSLSPAQQIRHASYVYEIPQPGRELGFHQYLVRRVKPDVTLRYTVDLNGKYFQRGVTGREVP